MCNVNSILMKVPICMHKCVCTMQVFTDNILFSSLAGKVSASTPSVVISCSKELKLENICKVGKSCVDMGRYNKNTKQE